MPTWMLANWRVIVIAVAIAVPSGIALWYRGEAARAGREFEAMRGAYTTLAQSVQRQNEEVRVWQRAAEDAAQRGAKARAEAQGAVNVATRSADALARAMGDQRPLECPTAKAVEVVRADLAR